jgi:CBS-domain-containing membrane protein
MKQILPESAKQRVKDIMSTNVITVYPETPVGEIARLMSDNDIGGLPVVDHQNKILGVVTELDLIARNTRFKMPTFFTILDSIIYLETPQHFRNRLKNILGTTAKEIMSTPAVTIAPNATIEDLAEQMIDRRMNPLPVVENNKLVGIISRSDVVRLMADEFEADNEET